MVDKTTKTKKETATKKPAVKKTETPKATKAKVSSVKPVPSDSGKFAVIKTGGKQYIVYEGKTYNFEKLTAEEGKNIEFSEVLLVSDGGSLKIGQPIVTGSKVTGKVISQFKDKKVTVLKYKPKKRYRKTQGHRQAQTKVEITKIV